MCATCRTLSPSLTRQIEIVPLLYYEGIWRSGDITPPYLFSALDKRKGALGSVVVKALCYKPGGRGLDTR
jgi:hypothetical protein